MPRLRQQEDLAGLTGLVPGDHVCYVIGSEEEFEAETAACLAEGSVAGQKLFRFMPASAIARRLPRRDGSPVTYTDPSQQFLGGGPLSAEVMLSIFAEQTALAHRDGFSGIRLVADMDWLLAHPPAPQQVAEFELALDKAVAELGATVVCAYRPDPFGEAVAETAVVHPKHAGRTPTEVPFRFWYDGDDRWQLCGEVDQAGIEPFERALRVAAAAGPVRAVGCSGVRFMSAAAIAALSRLAMMPRPHPMVIEDADETMRYCWHALRLNEHQSYVRFCDTSGDYRGGFVSGQGDSA